MSELNIISAVISFVTGGGLVTGVLALRKDKRDALQTDLDYTVQFREIAKQEVADMRAELEAMTAKVKNLEDRIFELETALKNKDRIITLAIGFIEELRDLFTKLNPKHPLPVVPKELHEYLKEEQI